MSSSEPVILRDLLFSKIPGSSRRKSIPLFVELTPTQLHIFEAIGTSGATSFTGSSPGDDFIKGKQIRTLWRDHEEDTQNIKRFDQPGRRSHMYKFYIQRPDGLYKFKCKEQECRDKWVKELMMSDTQACDLTAPAGAMTTTSEPEVDSLPSITYTQVHDSYMAPIQRTIPPRLERIKYEDESGHFPLQRQLSTESDFPRSRSASFGDGMSESGYSSSELGHNTRSRSVSYEKMPDWEHSLPASPTDATTTFPPPVTRVPTKVDHEKSEDNKLQLSELRILTKHLSLDNLADNNLKSLSPVPEETEADFENDPDQEIDYLLKDALEYQVDREGTTISLIEDMGIVIDVPPGAVPENHPDDVTIQINACIGGPFELPEGYELSSPIFHIEPGVKFAEKPVELSIVHFIDISNEEQCSELKFISAPFDSSIEEVMIRFKPLDGGVFWPSRRIGKIALQHFCLIGIAHHKSKREESVTSASVVEVSSVIRPRPVLPRKGKEAYIALLYSPLSFPVQLPCRYHVIFSISLSHPVFIKNLENQLMKKFSTDSEFWRTSCEVSYAGDIIELEIPHDTLQECGYEVHTDLGCTISKQNVDNIRRSRFSRSDYANYIDYPPRILLRIHQTSVDSTPSSSRAIHPKLKLKGTLEEKCFNLPLPVSDASLLSPQRSQGAPSTPTSSYSSRADRRSLVSLPRRRSIYGVPDPRELGERVTPHVHPKWHHIGIQLGLQPVTLSGIELKHPHDIQRRLDEVFCEWISRSEQNPTWLILIEALRLESIGERQLANELERSFD